MNVNLLPNKLLTLPGQQFLLNTLALILSLSKLS
jgi:hypothetical protein